VSAPRWSLPTNDGYLRQALELGALLRPGEIGHLVVRHERWCPLLKREGPCTCEPDVELLRGEAPAA
jgi:hypothetical protein